MNLQSTIETVLGVSSAWRVRDVVAHAEQQQVHIHIDKAATNLLGNLFRGRQENREFRWNDLPLGPYQTVIILTVPSRDNLRVEPWMMRSGTQMSERLINRIDKVAGLSAQGRTREMLSEIFKVSLATFKLPKVDVVAAEPGLSAVSKGGNAPKPVVASVTVPPADSNVWQYLIHEQITLDLKSLPLRLLLARLRLRFKLEQVTGIQLATELQRFFTERASAHVYELMQLNQRLATMQQEEEVVA